MTDALIRTEEPRGGIPLDVYNRRWPILAVLCLALLIVGIDGTIVNVALPSFVRELNATPSQLQWISDAYTLVFASLLLTAGSLGDKFGGAARCCSGSWCSVSAPSGAHWWGRPMP